MEKNIQITKKKSNGNDEYKVISIRVKDPTVKRLKETAEETNRSRNDIITIFIEHGLDIFKSE